MAMSPRRQSDRQGRGLNGQEFLDLYDSASDRLLRFFVRRTLDPEVAADLTAETFAAAFKARARYDRSRSDPSAWLFGIAQKELGSYYRRHSVERRARKKLQLNEPGLSSDDYERIEALIDFAEVGRLVRGALNKLSAEQREAVSYRILEDMAYEDIAAKVGCSPATARARVSRGLRALAQSIAPPEQSIPGGWQ